VEWLKVKTQSSSPSTAEKKKKSTGDRLWREAGHHGFPWSRMSFLEEILLSSIPRVACDPWKLRTLLDFIPYEIATVWSHGNRDIRSMGD
jgi:hypothetical protein